MVYLKRWQLTAMQDALKTRRVVILAGARQTGKTTLAKSIAGDATTYRTLDDNILLQAARADPHEFVMHHKKLMIIDEVQKALDLLPAIKKVVDENPQPGQYLLTGSANIQSLPGIHESLAGRIRKIPLRPLAQGEITGSEPIFLDSLFSEKTDQIRHPLLTKDDIITIAMRGGYPEAVSLFGKEVRHLHMDYLDALIERDLREIANIHRVQSMRELIYTVSAWSTKPLDISAVGSGLGIKRPTIETYLNAIETMYLIDHIQPWLKTDYERIAKKTKLIMNDSGLMSSILGWRFDDVRLDGDKLGKLIETHVGNELQKQIDANGDLYRLYHYRDREKREIDYIVERDDGAIALLEVKASTTVDKSDFKHIQWFINKSGGTNQHIIGVVLYTGNHILSFGNKLWAIPVSSLYGTP